MSNSYLCRPYHSFVFHLCKVETCFDEILFWNVPLEENRGKRGYMQSLSLEFLKVGGFDFPSHVMAPGTVKLPLVL
jgi:hypothetical protein